LAVGPESVDLDICSGQLLGFPGRGRLASAQPHGDVLDSHGLSRPQRKVANYPVPLVEQPQHRDPLRHGRNAWLLRGCARHVEGDRLVFRRLIAAITAARGQQQR
jgi:hypothetical protein